MDVAISEFSEHDRDALRDILRSSFDTLSTLDALELDCYIDGQHHPCRWYVARLSRGQVIGCINAATRSIDGDEQGYINSLSVREDWRGRHIGSMLVQKAIEYLKDLGCKSVFLYVRPNNVSAKIFYEKLGFINYGLTKSQMLEDVLLLRKTI